MTLPVFGASPLLSLVTAFEHRAVSRPVWRRSLRGAGLHWLRDRGGAINKLLQALAGRACARSCSSLGQGLQWAGWRVDLLGALRRSRPGGMAIDCGARPGPHVGLPSPADVVCSGSLTTEVPPAGPVCGVMVLAGGCGKSVGVVLDVGDRATYREKGGRGRRGALSLRRDAARYRAAARPSARARPRGGMLSVNSAPGRGPSCLRGAWSVAAVPSTALAPVVAGDLLGAFAWLGVLRQAQWRGVWSRGAYRLPVVPLGPCRDETWERVAGALGLWSGPTHVHCAQPTTGLD